MDTPVLPTEILYRIIKRSKPDTMTEDGRPTPALFEGVAISVDRDGGRPKESVIMDMKTFFKERLKGVVCFGADICFENGMVVSPAPTEKNEYHAEIFENKNMEDEPLSMLNALILADCAQVVFFDKSVLWT